MIELERTPASDAAEPTGPPGRDGSLPSPEALELVTDETRRAILTTLWDADDAPLAFTTLRHRSGIDDSARFNYHLQRLRRRCVHETGDGYTLTARGEQFVAALHAVPSLDADAGDASRVAD